MSFTADEVWENMPGARDDLGVFTAEWYDGLFAYAHADIDAALWEVVEPLRGQVTRTLEGLRKDGKIGSGLDAEVTIQADPSLRARLQTLGDELRFVLITSSATLAPLQASDADEVNRLADGSRFRIVASASEQAKCVRCWHHRADVGSNSSHSELCARCIDNIDGDGEQRHFA
jgi:isoleucyl-tRNA synthetase